MMNGVSKVFITRTLSSTSPPGPLPDHFQIQLARCARRHATEDPCVGWKRERNLSQVIHTHPGGNGYRRHLCDLYRTIADNVAAQDFIGRAVGDEFAETGRPPVDYRASGRIEAYNNSNCIMGFTRLRFGQSHLRILRVGETSDRTRLIPKRHRQAAHGVGCRDKTVLYRLRDQHQTTGDVPGGEDMWRRSSQVIVYSHEAPMIDLDACRREAQPGCIGHPAYRYDRERSLRAFPRAIFREDHAHADRRLLERINLAEVLAYHYS